MHQQTASILARFATVGLVFAASACVINRAQTRDDSSGTPPAGEAKAGDAKAGAKDTAKAEAAPVNPKGPAANQKAVKIAASALAPAKTGAPAAKPVPAATAKGVVPTAKGEVLVRFVNANVLNVRSAPDPKAPVIAKLARGSMFTVTFVGQWARLSDGQYVLSKYLATSQPAGGTRNKIARN